MATKEQIAWAASLTGEQREYFINELSRNIAEYSAHNVRMRCIKSKAEKWCKQNSSEDMVVIIQAS